MTVNLKGLPVALAALLAVFSSPASGQLQYEGIPVPPYEFYEALLAYADQGDYDSLPRGLKSILPLLKYLDRTYGERLQEQLNAAVRDHDSARLMERLHRVIYLDLVSHLEATVAGPVTSRRDRAQMAFINYTFLSPEVRRHSRERDQAIRRSFRELLEGSSEHGAAAGRIEKDIEAGMGWVHP